MGTLLVLATALWAAQNGPSFDCAKAVSPDEKLICSDPTLADLDRELAARYRQRIESAAPAGIKQIQAAQAAWLKARGAGCAQSRAACLKSAYEARLRELIPSGGRTFRFAIHPSLPAFTFEVTPGREIQVSRPGAPLQRIDISGIEAEPEPFEDAGLFWAVDMNFDGYADLQLLTLRAATGNTRSAYWLYDPSKGTFEPHEELSGLISAVADPRAKLVRTHEKGGAAGLIFDDADYRWEGGRLVKVRELTQDGQVRIVRELRGGQLVEVSRTKVKAPE
jgi:uncharacterized protein YecT (DUF1311 family)